MLKLIRLEGNVIDLAFDDPALATTDEDASASAAAATVIYCELYTDAEAPSGLAANRFDRRGWYYDPAAGTIIWCVRRQPLDEKARRQTLNNLTTRLTSRDPAFSDVAVEEEVPADPAGNISSVLVKITGFHNGRKFIVRAPL